jgi:acetylornithine deacetylase
VIQSSAISELTRQLIAIDSTNPELVPGGAGEVAIAEFVAAWLGRAGLYARLEEVAPGRPNVVATARGTGRGRSLMLNAHLDTVGAGHMDQPFVPRQEDNRLYGRGSYDMKGSLAAIMIVGAELAARPADGDVILTAVVDEEYASIGTQAIVERYRADAAIVTEPTALDLCIAHKGFVWLEIETTGIAAHGSRPDAGIDAIVKMGQVLTGIEQLDQQLRAHPTHPLLGSGSIHASLIDGGIELSTYPDHCRLSVERRTVPGESAARVEAEIGAILHDAATTDPRFASLCQMGLVRQPFEVAEDATIVQALRTQVTAKTGREPRLIGAAGWMDSALLAGTGIPTVVFGPAGDGAHATEEWVDVESVARCAEILLATAREFCS